jgi:(p)ppGpp synthase/HD superfamily hydrolase
MVQHAIDFAPLAHKDQVRKYTGDPYISHCIDVYRRLEQFDYVFEMCYGDEVFAAAILHDTVEDTAVKLWDIYHNFGSVVGEYVMWLTDCAKPEEGNRATRKGIERERLRHAPEIVQNIKVCDLIDNTRSIVAHDPKFAKVYLKEKDALLNVFTKAHPYLVGEARQLIIESYRKLEGTND